MNRFREYMNHFILLGESTGNIKQLYISKTLKTINPRFYFQDGDQI